MSAIPNSFTPSEYDQWHPEIHSLATIHARLYSSIGVPSIFEHILSNRGGLALLTKQKDVASLLVRDVIDHISPNKLSSFFILYKLNLVDLDARHEFQQNSSAPTQKNLTLFEYTVACLFSNKKSLFDGSLLLTECVYLIAPQTNTPLSVVFRTLAFSTLDSLKLLLKIDKNYVQSGADKSVAKNKLLSDALPLPTALLPIILGYSLEEDEEIASLAQTLHPLQYLKA